MKLTLHFNMDDIEDKEAFAIYHKANDYLKALHEIAAYFRKEIKYPPALYTQEHISSLESISDQFYEILNSFNIEL